MLRRTSGGCPDESAGARRQSHPGQESAFGRLRFQLPTNAGTVELCITQYTLLLFLLLSEGYSGKLRCTKLLPTTAGTVVHFEINSYWAVHQGVDSSCQPMLVWYSALHTVLGVQHFGTLRRIFWVLRGTLS